MRANPNYITNLSASIGQSSAAQAKLTNELSSGLRVQTLGDDPVAATQALRLSSEVSRDDTFVRSASAQTGVLQVTDSALGEVVTQLTAAISLATQATNGTLNAANAQAIAGQLTGIQEQILSLANTSYMGQYLFAGSKATTQPFTLGAGGAATYAGDTVQQTVTTPTGQSLATNLPGSSVFTAAFAALSAVIADLGTNPVSPTTAADGAQLSAALATVSSQRSVLGNSLNRLSASSTYTQAQVTNLEAQQSTLVSADTVQVATDLRNSETQHTALLDVMAALSKGSLFDYLK